MKIKSLAKYSFRFLLLQGVLTVFTIFYFDNYLIWSQEFKREIYFNLLEDKDRFFPILSDNLISVDLVLALLIFIFLIMLYSTKFYTYVNELTYSMNRNLLGEYFQIYLVWTSYLMISFFILRFNNLFRGSLLLFSFLVPLILLAFRNTEFISTVLGRSVTNESFISFNLDENSKFRKLRIMTFRKDLGNITYKDLSNEKEVIDKIDKLNKKEKVNLIIISLQKGQKINIELEKYLINMKIISICHKRLKNLTLAGFLTF